MTLEKTKKGTFRRGGKKDLTTGEGQVSENQYSWKGGSWRGKGVMLRTREKGTAKRKRINGTEGGRWVTQTELWIHNDGGGGLGKNPNEKGEVDI